MRRERGGRVLFSLAVAGRSPGSCSDYVQKATEFSCETSCAARGRVIKATSAAATVNQM